jgi:GntR family transcriptional regulator
LATELRVSVITTSRAYDELAAEGLISSMQGKGYFVTLNLERVEEECKFKIEQLILQAIDHCKVEKISKDGFMQMVDFLVEKELS